jgi:hypothetical protein
VLHSKVLGDESAHRPSPYAYTFEAEGLDHMRSVISELAMSNGFLSSVEFPIPR